MRYSYGRVKITYKEIQTWSVLGKIIPFQIRDERERDPPEIVNHSEKHKVTIIKYSISLKSLQQFELLETIKDREQELKKEKKRKERSEQVLVFACDRIHWA